MFWKGLAFVVCCFIAGAAAAQNGPIEVKNAWARATIGKHDVGAAYLTILSAVPDRLVAASTPVAAKADLMTMEGGSGAMKMRYLSAIEVPANRPVILNPDGLHVWLAGLKQPLKAGESFPLTLSFEKAGRRDVTVSIVKPGGRAPEGGAGMKMN